MEEWTKMLADNKIFSRTETGYGGVDQDAGRQQDFFGECPKSRVAEERKILNSLYQPSNLRIRKTIPLLEGRDRFEVLTNAQVITWFQNRLAQLKRDMEEWTKMLADNKIFSENVQNLELLKKEKSRTAFTNHQIFELEKRFELLKKEKSRTAFTNHQIFELEKRFLY
ncbi:hypothetical protein QE152_g5811 [Popillia japonica]|uniref:Homeobox domain-containing protein n=1 Tax=Popillia japonica TaxID=7064 RepID=A0AAW1MJ59_POPJA